MDYNNIKELYKINNYTLGEKAKWLRENHYKAKDNSSKGYMSCEKLAGAIGIGAGTISKIENGGNCNLSSIIDFADYFNVSIDWLCGKSSVSDTNLNLNYICDYTGLSEKAIEHIVFLTKTSKQHKELKEIVDCFISALSFGNMVRATADYNRLNAELVNNILLYNKNPNEDLRKLIETTYNTRYVKLSQIKDYCESIVKKQCEGQETADKQYDLYQLNFI